MASRISRSASVPSAGSALGYCDHARVTAFLSVDSANQRESNSWKPPNSSRRLPVSPAVWQPHSTVSSAVDGSATRQGLAELRAPQHRAHGVDDGVGQHLV